jgi:hypothetical protein
MSHDVDKIISLVEELIPEVEVCQMPKFNPSDDDRLWWFRLPGVRENIQMESATYDCPFIVEHHFMKNSSEAITCRCVQETVSQIVGFLRRIRVNPPGELTAASS